MRAVQPRPYLGGSRRRTRLAVPNQQHAGALSWHGNCNLCDQERHAEAVHFIVLLDLSQAQGRRIMKSKYLLLVLTILTFAVPIRSLAQQASSDASGAPLLTLEDAVTLALKTTAW